MSHWRMKTKCADCPFSRSGPGAFLRRTLRPGRWRSILRDLRAGKFFMCHKTTEETGDGSKRVCAGAIEYQEKNDIACQYTQICERLEHFRNLRITK
jgi:hypothetical protein